MFDKQGEQENKHHRLAIGEGGGDVGNMEASSDPQQRTVTRNAYTVKITRYTAIRVIHDLMTLAG